ncbi:MAG: TetR/AcrR family transcriptional regulator [Gemmatimonadaceae bacterium]
MPKSQSARLRATRNKLLGATFSEVFHRGFQGASLNDIAAVAGSTKGALFHHFESKQALGYAMTDEVLAPILYQRWLAPLIASDDPITTLQQLFRRHIDDDTTSGNLVYGCPMNNLAQEMSPLDSGFSTRLGSMYASWRETVAAALERGQHAGRVGDDVDVRASAMLIVLAQAGIWGTGKYSRDPQLMADAGEALCAYLDTLR